MTHADPFEHPWRLIRVDRRGAVAEVALARPEARNALSVELIEELTEVARRLRLRTDVQTVILTGTESFFSAGADLRERTRRLDADGLLEARRLVMGGPDMCRAWDEIEAVTIAAIEGFCIGGAAALAVSCDFRVMGRSASLRLPEVPLGMNMSWRVLPRIVSLMGPARAKRFVMLGEALDGPACLDQGLADEVADDGGALAAARTWADRVAALPPVSVRMTKEAINAIAGANAAASIYMDRDQYLLTSRSEDYREGVLAFREKRQPRFTGR